MLLEQNIQKYARSPVRIHTYNVLSSSMWLVSHSQICVRLYKIFEWYRMYVYFFTFWQKQNGCLLRCYVAFITIMIHCMQTKNGVKNDNNLKKKNSLHGKLPAGNHLPELLNVTWVMWVIHHRTKNINFVFLRIYTISKSLLSIQWYRKRF